jgi:ubiquinone/menaquinone biosynthesis C-methylase UbiE
MRSLLFAVALASLAGSICFAQVAAEANAGYKTAEGRARVAQSLANPEREKEQKPRELIASIGVERGDVVADIGTGVGFMIPYFLEAIGPQGKVYAEDIQQDFLDQVQAHKAEQGWENVETILGDQIDPKLPANSVDVAFILDAYHHFEQPAETMRAIQGALKPDGRLVVVDFYRSRSREGRDPDWAKNHIRADRDEFRAEIEAAGLVFERTFDHLPHQYALIFRKGDR